MLKFLFALVMTVSFTAFAKNAPTFKRKPASLPSGNVQVGGSEEYDACGAVGVVLATTTLITFSKTGQIQFGSVPLNSNVFMCDQSGEGEEAYVGIVFGVKNQDCGLGSPIKEKQDYKGKCKSGWIKKSFIELIAG